MRVFNIYLKGTGDLLGSVLENNRIEYKGFKGLEALLSQIRRDKTKDSIGIIIVESKKTKNGNLSGSNSLRVSVKELTSILNNSSSIKINKRKPLSLYDRQIIQDLKNKGFSYSDIAIKTSRSKGVISRALNH